MKRRSQLGTAVVCAVLGGAVALEAQGPGTVPGTYRGPNSSETPYVNPTAAGWEVASILSVGDPATNGYRMVGIPDGLGALAGRFNDGRYVDTNKFMTVFMNHELTVTAGVPRTHGQPGAFVSQWTIDLNTLGVVHGQDLIQNVYLWDTATKQYVHAPTAAFTRFCSADLPALGAFYNAATGRGFNGRILMNGEEAGTEGRAFGHVVTGALKGTSYELPYMGRFAWENALAHPNAGDHTIVVGMDDSTPGQLYVYRGTKRTSGNPVEKAGLVGGKLYGIRVLDGGPNYGHRAVRVENNGAVQGRFVLQDVSDATIGSGASLSEKSASRGVTEFARPEDGSWDPTNPRVFYFNTTGANIGGQFQTSKLYKLTFDNVQARSAGGTIELVIDRASLPPVGSPVFPQFDNLTVAGDGSVLVQEDSGNSPYLSRVWRVNPRTETATEIFISDPARFGVPTPPFTQDEENSGIIEVTSLFRPSALYQSGRRYFLGVMQAQYPFGDELVAGGQLYLMASPTPAP